MAHRATTVSPEINRLAAQQNATNEFCHTDRTNVMTNMLTYRTIKTK